MKILVPSPQKCQEIYQVYHTPLAVQQHCATVCDVAVAYANVWVERGGQVDMPLLVAGALLHDVAKGQDNHDTLGAAWLATMGYTAVATIIGNHMTLAPQFCNHISEVSLVYLADKSVSQTTQVTLADRFEKKIRAFQSQGNQQAAQHATTKYEHAKAILALLTKGTEGGGL